MSEFRAALQEVIMAGEACTQDDDIHNAVRYNRALTDAKALLTRPEPQNQKLYVFLQQRPRDKQPFPLVYVDQQLAEAAPHRVTPVVVVDVPMLPSPPDAKSAIPRMKPRTITLDEDEDGFEVEHNNEDDL